MLCSSPANHVVVTVLCFFFPGVYELEAVPVRLPVMRAPGTAGSPEAPLFWLVPVFREIAS